jgi:hypothetical protein
VAKIINAMMCDGVREVAYCNTLLRRDLYCYCGSIISFHHACMQKSEVRLAPAKVTMSFAEATLAPAMI